MRNPVKALTIALVAIAMCGLACSGTARRGPSAFTQKLVILGFDGMDPHLLKQWMDEGRLPNIAKLAKQGGLYPLQTTHSPESPTAWASFATGVNAGKHNIYDFLVRDTTTYLPDLGMVTRTPPKFLFNYFPIAKPKVASIRGGTSFWVTAGHAGVRSDILTVPVTFPPETVENGEMLSGLPLPDIRGTMGTFSYYATDLSRYEEGNTEMGGILKRLVVENDRATNDLEGPPSPIVRQQLEEIRRRGPNFSESDRTRMAELQAEQDVRVPFTLQWNRPGKSATLALDGADAQAAAGRLDAVDRPHLQGELPGAGPRHGPDAADERRQRAPALCLTGELQAERSAGADVLPGFVLRRSLQGGRQLQDARLGRSHLAAEREPHGREDVHGRPDGGLRRSRQGDPQPRRCRKTGTCWSG